MQPQALLRVMAVKRRFRLRARLTVLAWQDSALAM